MKNIIINETEYNEVSIIEVPTADGGTARFIDEDEGGSMRSETMTFSTISELYNKVNEIYAQNPLLTMKVNLSQTLSGRYAHHYLNNSDLPETVDEVFDTIVGTDTYFHMGSHTDGEFSLLSARGIGILNFIISSSETGIFWSDINIDVRYSELRQSYAVITDDNISTITFTFYY